MVRHGEEYAGAIIVNSRHRDVVAFSNNCETEPLKGSDHLTDGGVDGKLAHLDWQLGLCDERLNYWFSGINDISSKAINVEPDRGPDICKRRIIRVAFADDDSLEPQRVSDIAVCMFLHNDFQLSAHGNLPCLGYHSHNATASRRLPASSYAARRLGRSAFILGQLGRQGASAFLPASRVGYRERLCENPRITNRVPTTRQDRAPAMYSDPTSGSIRARLKGRVPTGPTFHTVRRVVGRLQVRPTLLLQGDGGRLKWRG